jgi:hypothetical protein
MNFDGNRLAFSSFFSKRNFILDKIPDFLNKGKALRPVLIKGDVDERTTLQLYRVNHMPASFQTQTQLLNFRKMKHDFSPQILREGKALYDKSQPTGATIVQFTDKIVKVTAQIKGAFGNSYTCEIEIDRIESEILDSNCDCPRTSDCSHLASFLLHLEEQFESLVIQYFDSKSSKAKSQNGKQKKKGRKKDKTFTTTRPLQCF